MEPVETLLFLGGSKITADGDCSHEIKRRLLLGRKPMTNLDSILKSRDITLLTNVRLVKAMVFPVVNKLPWFKLRKSCKMFFHLLWSTKKSFLQGGFFFKL